MNARTAPGPSKWRLAFLVAFAVIGAYLGYTIGSGWGSTNFVSAFSAAIALSLAIAIVVVLIVTAALVGWKSHNRLAAVLRVIRVGLFFLAALGIGWALSLVFGLLRPVVL